MKKHLSILFLLFSITLICSCTKSLEEHDHNIKVAVFKGLGADRECLSDAVEALKIDSQMKIRVITAADIQNGILKHFDVILFPGGGGSRQMSSLGRQAQEIVKEFARQKNKGILGICAGSYMLSDTPHYTCLRAMKAKAVDIEHDGRGHGLIEIKLTEEGKKIFPELAKFGKIFTQYYEGPLLEPSIDEVTYNTLATFVSDVHSEKNIPSGMTPGKPIFLLSEYGEGKVAASVAHPENTPGMRWIIPRMARWIAGKELVSYSDEVVRPGIYSEEALFDEARYAKEDKNYRTLMYGNSQEKIAAIEDVVDIRCWGAKERVTGLIRDDNSDVRLAAAKAITYLEHTAAIKDLKIAIKSEKDNRVKEEMENLLQKMKTMINE